MSNTVTISVEASDPETDAPTVDDLLGQLRDYFDLLGIVEGTIASDGQSAVEWRVVNAAKASPLSVTLQAFARQYAVNVDVRVEAVLAHTFAGMEHLRVYGTRPPSFPDEAVQKAENIFERVTNGLARTVIRHDQSKMPPIELTPTVARVAVKNARAVLAPIGAPYKEIGSLEGYFGSVTLDGYGRKVLYIKSRLTGEEVKCFVSGAAERELELREIGDVWRKRRILVSGLLHFKAPGRISHVDVDGIRFLRGRNELPDVDDIIDVDFTGGVRSEDYLAKLRDGESN